MNAPHSPCTEPLLLPKEAAGLLRLSVQRLASMRLEGTGPEFLKIGHRTVMYSRQAIDAWLEKNRRQSTSDTQAAA